MRIPDANVLIYARDADSAHHRTAIDWVQRTLSGAELVGFPVVALLAFVRLSTNSRIFTAPLRPTEALDQVQQWLAVSVASLIHPGPRHFDIVRSLLAHAGTAANLTTDAHLAALAIEHGATLASFDGDFHRFESLSLEYLR